MTKSIPHYCCNQYVQCSDAGCKSNTGTMQMIVQMCICFNYQIRQTWQNMYYSGAQHPISITPVFTSVKEIMLRTGALEIPDHWSHKCTSPSSTDSVHTHKLAHSVISCTTTHTYTARDQLNACNPSSLVLRPSPPPVQCTCACAPHNTGKKTTEQICPHLSLFFLPRIKLCACTLCTEEGEGQRRGYNPSRLPRDGIHESKWLPFCASP